MSVGNLETSAAEVQRRFERIIEGLATPAQRSRVDDGTQVRAASCPASGGRAFGDGGYAYPGSQHSLPAMQAGGSSATAPFGMWGGEASIEGPAHLTRRLENDIKNFALNAHPASQRSRSFPPYGSHGMSPQDPAEPNAFGGSLPPTAFLSGMGSGNDLAQADLTFGQLPPAPAVAPFILGPCEAFDGPLLIPSASQNLGDYRAPSGAIDFTSEFGVSNVGFPGYDDVENNAANFAMSMGHVAMHKPGYGSVPCSSAELDTKLNSKFHGVLVDAPGALRVFYSTFTFFCFALFAMPIWTTYHVGQDQNVQQWITNNLSVVLYLFLVYLVVHVVHFARGAPSKPLLITSLLGSCVILLLVGDYVLLESYKLSSAFASTDCDTFAEKRTMEVEWQMARTFYVSCMEDLARGQSLTLNQTISRYKIEDCPSYANAAATKHVDWPYLGYLEETYHCSGWCEERPPLWTFAMTKDSCSATVADVLSNKIQWSMMQVVIYTILVLGFVSVLLLSAGPLLQQHGVAW